jgi:hypothetical protein
MKENQDHTVVTQWGGRTERYRDFPRTENRAHDPFEIQPVQFGHAYHYGAWVLERFAANTKSITSRPTTVSAVASGVELSAKATYVVTRRDGSVEYFLVTKTEVPTPALRCLRRIAKANGAQVVHRTRADIRARTDEFWWLEKLRQCAAIWVGKGSELDEPLVVLAATERNSLAELCDLLRAPMDLVRARLARLHVAGRVVIGRARGELTVTTAVKGMSQ